MYINRCKISLFGMCQETVGGSNIERGGPGHELVEGPIGGYLPLDKMQHRQGPNIPNDIDAHQTRWHRSR